MPAQPKDEQWMIFISVLPDRLTVKAVQRECDQ